MELKSNGIIGQSASLAGVFKILGKVAPTDSTVLVTGESGTGKELLVRALHAASPRADRPFVPVNCGAIPRDLLESELFGHEKGAFTHALRSRPGRFELADGGTIFLDEIGEMEPGLQVKILRVLQEKEIERVGGTGCRKVDVRIVAATNRDLEAAVAAGTFSEDLYYRLNVIPIHLPPLRERMEELPTISSLYLGNLNVELARQIIGFEPEAMALLETYDWPCNYTQFKRVINELAVITSTPYISARDVRSLLEKERASSSTGSGQAEETRHTGLDINRTLDEITCDLIGQVLSQNNGNQSAAAKQLGISRTTLWRYMNRK